MVIGCLKKESLLIVWLGNLSFIRRKDQKINTGFITHSPINLTVYKEDLNSE